LFKFNLFKFCSNSVLKFEHVHELFKNWGEKFEHVHEPFMNTWTTFFRVFVQLVHEQKLGLRPLKYTKQQMGGVHTPFIRVGVDSSRYPGPVPGTGPPPGVPGSTSGPVERLRVRNGTCGSIPVRTGGHTRLLSVWVHLCTTPMEITQDVDVLSGGGTSDNLVFCELVRLVNSWLFLWLV